jgi:alpha-N-acetylglucosaminidase
VWWDWPRWSAYLDWLALQGINMPLMMVGQEAVWRRVWLRMGLSEQQVGDHFSGPPFLAWSAK